MAFLVARFAVVLLVCNINTLANVVLKSDTITFDRKDNGLDWPLHDVTNAGVLIEHGIHCYELMENVQLVEESETVHRMHKQHCASVMQKLPLFFESNPTFKIDPLICETLQDSREPNGVGSGAMPRPWWYITDTKVNDKAAPKADTPQAMPRPWWYITDHKAPNAVPGVWWYINDASMPHTSQAALIHSANGNVMKLLMKSANKEPMTAQETAYLQQLVSPTSIRLAAMGIYCKVNGDVERVKNTLKNIN